MNGTAFLMTTLAGISTMIGSIFIFFKNKNEDNILISSLAFASGVMITVSIIDLIPESFNKIGILSPFLGAILIILIGINIGILTSRLIEKKVSKSNGSSLYQIGIISMLAIILHNIPEGIATYLSVSRDFSLGLKLTIAIALHNIPEGISISIPIYFATKNKIKALSYTFLSGFSEVVGAVITFLFLENIMNDFLMGFLYSVIAGIMISISVRELLPESFSYKKNLKTLLFLVLGIIFMTISHIML